MRILIGGFCLLLLTACQSGGGSTEGGDQPKGNRLTLKKKEDREFLKTATSRGTKDHVTKDMIIKLLKYGISKGYSSISERDVEEQLNQIAINCDGDICATESIK